MDRRQRRAAELEKYAAMSRPRKVALLVLAVVLAGVTCLGTGYLLGGEWRIGLSLAVGVAIAATMAVQYRDAW